MHRNAHSISLAALTAAALLVAASPSFGAAQGGTGQDATGDVYADLTVILRDVHGVPVVTGFDVPAEVGTTTEYCVQPVSYSALPGLAGFVENAADGRLVQLIPLMGEKIVAGEVDPEEAEACDPQPAYAMYVKEAELERLNMARQPSDVQDKKLAEVAIRLSTATEITLDSAGRITTDGVPIDAAPDHAAIFSALMSTGAIPGLDTAPARVEGFDTWMLAAAAIGVATGKGVPITIDAVQYYNRISAVPAEYEASDQVPGWSVNFLQAASPVATPPESFVDYSAFSYTRSDLYPGCATWLDVPSLTWKVNPISEVVDFGGLPPVAEAGTVTDIAGFAQLADDVRAVIVYLHENDVIPGFFMDPVGQNSCGEQGAALTTPAVSLAGLPNSVIQTDTIPVTTSLYMPWLGSDLTGQVVVTIESAQPFELDQVTAVATAGAGAGSSVSFTKVAGNKLIGTFGPVGGFPMTPGYGATTTFDLTVAPGAPTGAYTLTLGLIDVTGDDVVDLDTEVVLAQDSASTEVLPAALTVLWTDVTDYAAEGTFVPMTARLFNPDLGAWGLGQTAVTGARFRMTIDAPDPFALATQVAAWSEATPMTFSPDGDGNLVGWWDVQGTITAPYDQLTTWYLNVAEGAPIGMYVVGIEIVDSGDAVLSSDLTEITIAAAPTHEGGGSGGGGGGGGSGGSGGGGSGGGGGEGDGEATLPPVAAITDGAALATSDTTATFTLSADQAAATFLCSLDGAAATGCTSPVTYASLTDGTHTLAVTATDGTGKVGPTAIRTWTVDTVDPTISIVSAPAPASSVTDAAFELAATGQVALLCGLDGAALTRCTSPVHYTGLTDGTHVFAVSAVDAAGNYASTSRTWIVTTAHPDPMTVHPAPDAAYVRALYRDFLGRSASDLEVGSWLGQMDRGLSRHGLASAIAYSGERIARVIPQFYRDTLNREPDVAGLAFWVGAAKSGKPMAQIASEFYASTEYFTTTGKGDNETWVRDLYRVLLLREPDAAGLRHWVGKLEAGVSRPDVSYSFYQSRETAALRVDGLYQSLLGRHAEPGGLETWTPIVTAQGDLALAASLATSEEYVASATR